MKNRRVAPPPLYTGLYTRLYYPCRRAGAYIKRVPELGESSLAFYTAVNATANASYEARVSRRASPAADK